MTSRRQIEKFCTENNITIVELKYDRRTEWIYGDGCDDSMWRGTFKFQDCVEVFEEYFPEDMVESLQSWLTEDMLELEANNG